MPVAKYTISERPSAKLYEADYQQWLFSNADLLRQGRLSEIDAANIAEELEDMGRSEARSLRSHLRVLLTHLLKWQFQPTERSSSWRGSIYNARKAISRLLRDSPSLRRRIPEYLPDEYTDARFHASNETGLPEASFPTDCPYSINDLLDIDFWPAEIA